MNLGNIFVASSVMLLFAPTLQLSTEGFFASPDVILFNARAQQLSEL